MQPDDPSLAEEEVLAHGGWHPRYARVLAVASDGDYGDYGFAVVDGNGDGADLEAEMWQWDCGNWDGAGSSGAGLLDTLGPARTGGQIGNAYFAAITFPSAATSLALHQSPHRPLRPRISFPDGSTGTRTPPAPTRKRRHRSRGQRQGTWPSPITAADRP